MNRQSSTASLSGLERSWYGDVQSGSQTDRATVPLNVPAPLAALAHSTSGSSVIAAAASQAIAATQQVSCVVQIHWGAFDVT